MCVFCLPVVDYPGPFLFEGINICFESSAPGGVIFFSAGPQSVTLGSYNLCFFRVANYDA